MIILKNSNDLTEGHRYVYDMYFQDSRYCRKESIAPNCVDKQLKYLADRMVIDAVMPSSVKNELIMFSGDEYYVIGKNDREDDYYKGREFTVCENNALIY